MLEREGDALVVLHSPEWGRQETPVEWFRVEDPRPYGPYHSVLVWFLRIGKRKRYLWLMPHTGRYLVVEVEGAVVYDSRKDVPCDPPAEKKNPPAEKKKRPSRAKKATEVAGCNQDAVEAAVAE